MLCVDKMSRDRRRQTRTKWGDARFGKRDAGWRRDREIWPYSMKTWVGSIRRCTIGPATVCGSITEPCRRSSASLGAAARGGRAGSVMLLLGSSRHLVRARMPGRAGAAAAERL